MDPTLTQDENLDICQLSHYDKKSLGYQKNLQINNLLNFP